jgi:hypothetical protein
VVEIEAVHLGLHQTPVDLLRDVPAARVDSRQPPLPRGKLAVLCRHGCRRVIGHPVYQRRLLERAPLDEQLDQVVVASGHCRGRCREDQHSGRGKSHDDGRPRSGRGVTGVHGGGV